MNHPNEHPEIAEHEWIDNIFRVEETRWKTWKSFHKDGRALVMSLTKEQCLDATRFYLKGLQEGWDDTDVKTHEGTVGGKL